MNPGDLRSIDTLLRIMARLRDPQTGCPWDREQDFATIAPYTIEEAYEVAEAIDRADLAELRDELGDLLFQVVFHAQMANEKSAFGFADVVEAINAKMIRRHPHVFADARVGSAEEQRDAWEAHKSREREGVSTDSSALAGIGTALPALMRAQKLGRRAARAGFDWSDAAGPLRKIHEEIVELQQARDSNDPVHIREEFGDLLFSLVNLGRHLGVDAEDALRLANHKFERRFRAVESRVKAEGKDWKTLSAEELDVIWEAVKASERDAEPSVRSPAARAPRRQEL